MAPLCHRVPKISFQHCSVCPRRARIYGKEWEKLSSCFVGVGMRGLFEGEKAELAI